MSKILKFSEYSKYSLLESKKQIIQFDNCNISLKDFKYDINGNRIVSLQFLNKGSFTIQTSESLKESEYLLTRKKLTDLNENDIIVIENEVINYIQKFGTKFQKDNLVVYNEILEGRKLNNPMCKVYQCTNNNGAQDEMFVYRNWFVTKGSKSIFLAKRNQKFYDGMNFDKIQDIDIFTVKPVNDIEYFVKMVDENIEYLKSV